MFVLADVIANVLLVDLITNYNIKADVIAC